MNDNKLSNVLQWASFIAIVPFAAHLFGFITMPTILFSATIAVLSVTVLWGLMSKTGETKSLELNPIPVETKTIRGNQY
jgi:hypothetical protein